MARKRDERPSLEADLRADYDALGVLLGGLTSGSEAAAVVRERRMLREKIEQIGAEEGDAVVDRLAGNVTRLDKGRRGRAGAAGAAPRGRKSG